MRPRPWFWLGALLIAVCFPRSSGAAGGLRFHWDFNEIDQKSDAPNRALRVAALRVAKWSENGGIAGSGGLVCGQGLCTIKARFPNLRYRAATLELAFKPTAPVTEYGVLFSYARSSWGRGVFDLFLDGKGHVGASFLVRSEDCKTTLKNVQLLSEPHVFRVGKWHMLRLTMEQGGTMKLYLDGRLEGAVDDAPCFADFEEKRPRDYPVVQVGSRVWRGGPEQPFGGLIDEVRVWDHVADPESNGHQPVAPAPGTPQDTVIVSKRVAAPPRIDGELDDACWRGAERTRPFTVLGTLSPTVTGLWLAGEEKFVRNAASAQICHDDENLYVACRAGAPADVPARAAVTKHDGSVWSEDCVELFIDPMRRLGYCQIVVNAIGTVADLESPPGTGSEDFRWESKAQVRTRESGTGFVVEMAVPFSSLGEVRRDAGVAWGVNFTREGASGGGLSTWAPVGRTFGSPERFGLLVFESRKAYHERELDRLRKRLARLPKETLPELAASAERLLESLARDIGRDGEDPSAWTTIARLTAEAEAVVNRIAMRGRTYVLWRKDIWGRISPGEKPDAQVQELTALDVFSARNTRAATGFLITNVSARPLMGRLVAKAPSPEATLPDGTVLLPGDHLRFRRGLYIELSNGTKIPDALPLLSALNLVEVAPGTTVLVWVDIETRGLPAGKYWREIEFSPSYSGFVKTSFALALEVAPVDLSAPRVGQFAYHIPGTQRFRALARDLAEHGVTMVYFMPGANSGRLHGYPKLDADGSILSMDHSHLDLLIANMVRAGVPVERQDIVIGLGFNTNWYRDLIYDNEGQLEYGTEAWKRGFANSLKAIRDHLFEKGFSYDQMVFYVYDEPHGDPADPKSSTAKAIEGSRYVKHVDPKFRTMTNPGLDKGDERFLDAYIREFDILMPYRPHLAKCPELIAELRNSGVEVWTYHILHKPNSPSGIYRNMAWQAARDGFAGVCAFWRYESGAGDLLNSYDHAPGSPHRTADYNVVYADWGPLWEGQLDRDIAVIPSRRWEGSYQGNQDYRAILICREVVAELKAAGKDVSEFETAVQQAIARAAGGSGAGMDAAREKLIRLALQMRREQQK